MINLTYLNGKSEQVQRVKIIYGRGNEIVCKKETIEIAESGIAIIEKEGVPHQISKDVIRVVKIKKNNKWTLYDYISLWARKEK